MSARTVQALRSGSDEFIIRDRRNINPNWTEPPPGMDDIDHALFPRFSAELVTIALKDTPVVMVTGPRQCGKTTLVRDLVAAKREFITLDDDTVLAAARSDPCASPKLCPCRKSTACAISSIARFAMTMVHVQLFAAMFRTVGPLLSFPSQTAAGELGASSATRGTEAQASQANTLAFGQALLDARVPVLVGMEEVPPGGDS